MNIEPATRLGTAAFAEKFVVLPAAYNPPGPFRIDRSRYLLGPWEALDDPEVREVTVMKSTQTGGSLVGDIWNARNIRVAPGPTFLNMQTDEDAKDHASLRINELLDRCEPVRFILPVGHKGKLKRLTQELKMQAMWMIIQGANLSNLQSKSVCYETNDEIVFWQPDSLIRDAYARLTAFGWQRKIYNVSQGGMVGDEHDRKYKGGTMEEWSWLCPGCSLMQPYKWTYDNNPEERGGMKWETNDDTKPEGQWNFEELAKTVYMECRQCAAKIYDIPKNRQLLSDTGEYVQQNFTAPRSRRSFHWNALACDAIPWAEIVWEFVEEVIPEYRQGNREPLQKFIQKKLADSDDEGVNWFDTLKIQSSDYQLDENGAFPAWDEEVIRFMAVDKQIDHYWWVVRAFSRVGTSRLVACGKAWTYVELEVLREAHKVESKYTAIDAGAWATDVYMACCVYGWRCLKGEDDKSFTWKDENGETIYKPYSEAIKRDPIFGFKGADLNKEEVREFQETRKFRHAVLCRWSNPAIKDLLHNLRTGLGLYYGIPANVGDDYTNQMNGEQRQVKVNKATGKRTWFWKKVGRAGDHLRDCECMILVQAAIRGLLMGRVK